MKAPPKPDPTAWADLGLMRFANLPSTGFDAMIRFRSRLLTAALCAYSPAALAGDMDAVGIFILGIYVYVGITVALSIFAVIACKRIESPWRRALARLLVVVAIYTPIPRTGYYQEVLLQPAFLAVWGTHVSWPHSGWLSPPFLVAYGGALLMGIPIMMLWVYLTSRYSRVA